jgi:hypothetical protein
MSEVATSRAKRFERRQTRAPMGVPSVIVDGLFGSVFPDDTAAYFPLEVHRNSMPVVRSNVDRTSFNRKLLICWEAWKQKLHVEQFGVNQIRVVTVTDSVKRVDNILTVVDEITAGKGSNFFMFGHKAQFDNNRLLDVIWKTGKKQQVRSLD